MKDKDKIKDKLIEEFNILRQRVAESQKSEAKITQAELVVEEARKYAEIIVDTVREPLILLDEDLRVISANRSFYQSFKVKPKETTGQYLYDLGNRQWNIPKLRELLEEIIPKHITFDKPDFFH